MRMGFQYSGAEWFSDVFLPSFLHRRIAHILHRSSALARESTVSIPMTAIKLSKITVMFLIVAAPALPIVKHIHRIAINIRCFDSKRHRQPTSKLLSLPTWDTSKFVIPNNFLVAVKQLHVEAINRCIDALSLILLVLPDMHAAPAAVVGIAVGLGDAVFADTLHGLFMRGNESTCFTETVVRSIVTQAAFVPEKAEKGTTSKRDVDHNSVCMDWVRISDERCTEEGDDFIGGFTLGHLRGQLKAAATEFYFLALHRR